MRSDSLRVLLINDGHSPRLQPLQRFLQSIGPCHLQLSVAAVLPRRLDDYDALVVAAPASRSPGESERLTSFAQRGGALLGLLQADDHALPAFWGTRVGEPGPVGELRLRFADPASSLARRMPSSFFVRDQFLPLAALDPATRTLLSTSWHYQQAPLALIRPLGDGHVACLSLQCFDEPLVQQLTYRLIRAATRREEPPALGVAVLGYGPSDAVGYRHGTAVAAVPGLAFRAACDSNPARLDAARAEFPGLRTYTDGRQLGQDDAVDVVIVATPPNSHAALVIELLNAGKHVVCEKPLCITSAEAAAMQAAALQNDRMLTTHQNRRWDADFLAIKQAIAAGLIGQPFHLEAFVGGFFHPCDYWHSHAAISGGALYDWGAHYVDSILQLFDAPPASVTSTAHKRVWHDVSNADQERVQIRFADGREAEFLYSEIAAIRKPKWYILGTEGAIVGHWNNIVLREPHRTAFFSEQEVPVTEAPPQLTLSRRSADGTLAEQQLPLPTARPYPFHHNLAEHLLQGEPLAVPPEQSARVVAVLEAAARSAGRGGSTEVLDG